MNEPAGQPTGQPAGRSVSSVSSVSRPVKRLAGRPPTRRPLYVVGHGLVLGRSGGRLVASRDGAVVTSAPLGRISEVVAFGNVGITTPAMTALLAEDIPLVLLTADGRVRGRLEPPKASHIEARRRQALLHHDDPARLELARAFVRGKIHNQDVLLRRRAARAAEPAEVWALARRVAAAGAAVDNAASIAELVGIEGAASGAYFRGIRLLLPDELGFRRRERLDPDLVNILINYTSALLREVVFGAVVAAGLDPYTSFLHAPRPGRPTLVFDLMEEWRAVLLESTVLGVLGLRMIRPEDLSTGPAPRGGGADNSTDGGTDGRPRLGPAASAAVIARFRARVDSPARSWTASPGTTYATLIRGQSLALRGRLVDSVPYEPFHWR
ncbi:CRISPR-associated endonuclease Cas1 [Frankia sp. CiP1_Cm_nod2]|uniref:CRISPR-associated endonuclease Cas1 n=1 Tax=Frankia sp. CiP1_Cm_nod2 TaxID=2897161 RepID=UPI0020246C21